MLWAGGGRKVRGWFVPGPGGCPPVSVHWKELVAALDLVIRGGRLLDPSRNLDGSYDIAIANGRIAAIEPRLHDAGAPDRQIACDDPAPPSLDATGGLVVPGLIDVHAHVYSGVCPLAVPADEAAWSGGVTTIVSAGDAGAHTIDGFRHLVVHRSRTRVLAFLHISAIGLVGWPQGEAINVAHLDVEAATRAVEANRDIVVGIKVRQSAPRIVGDNGLEPLRRALEVGRRTELPVMVHIGGAPAPLRDILQLLRPGDVVTHCFTSSGHGLVEGGELIPEALAARERGVLFDVGHGAYAFDYGNAETAAESGFWPDCVSTDLHRLSASGAARDLPTTMSKMLGLGMPLKEVIRAVTGSPASVIGHSHEVGSLRVNRVADVTILDLEEGDHMFTDGSGHSRRASRHFRVRHTVRAGIPWGGPWPHPGRLLGTMSHTSARRLAGPTLDGGDAATP